MPEPHETVAYRSLDKGTPVALLPVRLETRWFESPGGGLELRARIYPDQIHVSPLRDGVDPVEREETIAYWRVASDRGSDHPSALDRRARLDTMFGAPRARRLVAELAPLREGESLVFPDLPEASADESRVEATALPDRFALVGIAGAERRFVAWGERVPASVAVGPFGSPEHELAWQADFATAAAIGLAIRVTLDRSVAGSLTRLLALGVREDESPLAQGETLASLLERHAGESGATLLEAGTPTSHGEFARAGAARAIPDGALPPESDGARLARALGVAPERLRGIAGAAAATDLRAGAMNLATWPATVGYFLDQMLGEMIPDATIEKGRRLFRDHVRARGPFPTLCLGQQPYGVLPVSSLTAWRKSDGSEDGLAFALRAMRVEWRARTADLPRIGRTADRLRDLAEVLATSPLGVRWLVRGLVPDEVAASNHGPFDLGAAVNDIVDAMNETMEGFALVGLGLAGAPNLLDVIFDDAAALLGAPLVAPAGSDRSAPLTANYLRALASPGSIEALRDHAVEGATPRTLLYLVLRHATLLAVAGAGDAVLDVPRAERAEAHVRTGAIRTVWSRLSSPAVHGSTHPLGDALVLGEISTPATAALAEHRAALASLADAPVVDLEQLTAESLDVASHRLDAWITSLATERLFRLREATPEGIYVGAWCSVSSPPVPEAPTRDGREPVADSRSRGFLHAPSLHHAGTAAVLRAGFLARASDGDANPTAIDLSSSRVREALWLLDGTRAGRGVNELLGHRIERWLTESHEGAAIATLREAFPLGGTAQGGRLDGLAVHHAWRAAPPGGGLSPVAARLFELVDAASDLMLAEAVHQHAGGNPVRARAALEVLSSGSHASPELAVARSPVDADHVEWRVMLVPTFPPTLWPSGGTGIRTTAHPELSAWAGALLGDPAALKFGALVRRDEAVEAREVSVADLDLGPLDLVALAGEDAPAAALEALVRDRLGDPLAELAPAPPLARALECARALRRLLEGARTLEQRDVSADAAPPPIDLDGPLAAIRAAIASLRDGLDEPAAKRAATALLGVAIADPAAASAAIDDVVRRADAAENAGAALVALTRFPALGACALSDRPAATELARASERTAWLHDYSRVRPQIAALEQIDLASRSVLGRPLAFELFAPTPGVRLLVIGDTAAPVLRGVRVDGWTDAVPRATTTTGLSLHYDAPSTRAPQAVLLAVPPVPSEGWTFDVLESLVLETEELARLRLVRPHAVHGTYLPAIYLAENLEGETVSTDLRAVAVDVVVREG